MRKTVFALCVLAVLLPVLTGCRNPESNDVDRLNDYDIVESLLERFVVRYDADAGYPLDTPLNTWKYNAHGSLREYAVYDYDEDGLLSGVRSYSSSTAVSDSTLVSTILYTYDGEGNITHAELRNRTGVVQAYFDAEYATDTLYPWNCTKYLEYGMSDDATPVLEVVEHRECTYNEDGDYLVETYYSGAEAVESDLIERYECFYDDPGDSWKWTSERHMYLQSEFSEGAAPVTGNRYMVYTYTWNGDDMYLQSDFEADEEYAPGAMVTAIMYTFEDGAVKSESRFSREGKLMRWDTYRYDDSDRMVEQCCYNFSAGDGEELTGKMTWRFYTAGTDESLYERKTYGYGHTDRSLRGVSSPLPPGTMRNPQASHHRAD